MIPVAEPLLGEREVAYVTDCIKTGWVSSLGKYIAMFEEGFSSYCGAKHGISTANGTTALHLALVTLGIGAGDEVLVPSLTFVATANVVRHAGAKPVFVDSEPMTWNIDPAKIEEMITPRTKAIIPVHVYGHPADMDPIMGIAREHNLYVVEDAAEAHGAEYKGRRVGSIGDMGCFSFYGNKIITTGEGGIILTDDEDLASRARFLRDHAMSAERRYWHPEVGYNYRMANLQAALGVSQLERIDEFIQTKRDNAALYTSLLSDAEGLTMPPEAPWAKSVYWMYSVLVKEEFGTGRDELMLALKRRGIESRPFFSPVHLMPPHFQEQCFPVAESLAAKGINLPSSCTLTREQIVFICETLLELAEGCQAS